MEEKKGALLSEPDRLYRWLLWRTWGSDDDPRAVFVGLNPSTADETEDDHTISRCRTMAKAWGCGGFDMINLYGWRSKSPRVLWDGSVANPIGPRCDEMIRAMCAKEQTAVVILGWGSFPKAKRRGARVIEMITRAGVAIHVIGTTKTGYPRHPGGRDLPRVPRPQLWSPGHAVSVVSHL